MTKTAGSSNEILSDFNKKITNIKKVENFLSTRKKNPVMVLSANNLYLTTQKLRTSVWNIDKKIDGGIPVGKNTTIWGAESAGKTTTCLKIISEAQRTCRYCMERIDLCYKEDKKFGIPKGCSKCGVPGGFTALWIDAESSFDPEYAERYGVITDPDSPSRLTVVRPEDAEQAIDSAEYFLQNGIDLMILDCVAALDPLSEIERKPGEAPKMAYLNNIIRQLIIKIKSCSNSKYPPTTVFINQLREKAPPRGQGFMGTIQYQPGGHALLHYSHLIIKLSKTGSSYDKISEDGDLLMANFNVFIEKAKTCKPKGKSQYKFWFCDKEEADGDRIRVLGDTEDDIEILNDLKETGLCVEEKNKYHVAGKFTFKTQKEIKQKIKTDYAFRKSCEKALLAFRKAKKVKT